MEKKVTDMLAKRKWTITCAESCTGGLLSARLVNVAGVSEVYKSGIITYANEAKRRFLHVRKNTLRKYGAVSAQTAEEMAKGAAKLAKAEVSLAITGIAGPDGGTTGKPVGLVYIACWVKGCVTVEECHFSGNRMEVRNAAVEYALTLAEKCITEYDE